MDPLTSVKERVVFWRDMALRLFYVLVGREDRGTLVAIILQQIHDVLICCARKGSEQELLEIRLA